MDARILRHKIKGNGGMGVEELEEILNIEMKYSLFTKLFTNRTGPGPGHFVISFTDMALL